MKSMISYVFRVKNLYETTYLRQELKQSSLTMGFVGAHHFSM